MNLGLVIAVVGLALVGVVLFFGLVFVVALAWYLRRRPAPAVAPTPDADEGAMHPHHADAAETEVFSREALFAFYDSDEHDPTVEGRLDGGILIDGRTDPAIGVTGEGPALARKK